MKTLFALFLLITSLLLALPQHSHPQVHKQLAPDLERQLVQIECQTRSYICPKGPDATTLDDIREQDKNVFKRSATPAPIEYGQWQLKCRHDAIYDTKNCSISRGPLFVHLSRGRSSIRALIFLIQSEEAHPGRTHALRVDQHAPHSNHMEASWSHEEAMRIIAEMKTGHLVRTRFIAWPYGNAIDDIIHLDGFNTAFQHLQAAVNQP